MLYHCHQPGVKNQNAVTLMPTLTIDCHIILRCHGSRASPLCLDLPQVIEVKLEHLLMRTEKDPLRRWEPCSTWKLLCTLIALVDEICLARLHASIFEMWGCMFLFFAFAVMQLCAVLFLMCLSDVQKLHCGGMEWACEHEFCLHYFVPRYPIRVRKTLQNICPWK